jgi:hypothetical protein
LGHKYLTFGCLFDVRHQESDHRLAAMKTTPRALRAFRLRAAADRRREQLELEAQVYQFRPRPEPLLVSAQVSDHWKHPHSSAGGEAD